MPMPRIETKQRNRKSFRTWRFLKSRNFSVVVMMLLLMARDPASAADTTPPVPAKLDLLSSFFESEVAAGKISGAIVVIQQHGRPVYVNTFGVRNVRTGRPMTMDTIVALRSMTKPI